jgi:hypothetical protein
MATISFHTSSLASLLVINMALFAVKISGEIEMLPWAIVVTPIVIVQCTWLWHFICIAQRSAREEIVVEFYQQCCIVLYSSSFILGLLAEFITIFTANQFAPVALLFSQVFMSGEMTLFLSNLLFS